MSFLLIIEKTRFLNQTPVKIDNIIMKIIFNTNTKSMSILSPCIYINPQKFVAVNYEYVYYTTNIAVCLL